MKLRGSKFKTSNIREMKASFFSSFGFFMLAWISKREDIKDVMYGCIICGITSVLNHWHGSAHPVYRTVDMVLVNATGLYFVNQSRAALANDGYSKDHAAVLFAALSTVGLYLGLRENEEWYFAVHLSAFAGIWFYIKAKSTCHEKCAQLAANGLLFTRHIQEHKQPRCFHVEPRQTATTCESANSYRKSYHTF